MKFLVTLTKAICVQMMYIPSQSHILMHAFYSSMQDKDDVAYEMNNPNVRFCSVHDILTTHNLVILVAVPLYEFVICPLFRNYIPTSLKKIGIGIVLDIAAVVCVLALDLYVHEGRDHTPKDYCILSEMNTTNPNSTLSAAVIVLPITLDTLSELIVFVSSKS